MDNETPPPIFSDGIFLHIFSHLSLAGLIRARTVCSKWRVMVLQAYIRPLRQYFLEFYNRAIEFHTSLPSRPWVLDNLTPFDREAFISRLEAAHFSCIPEDFKLWILERSARAVLGPVWSGLPSQCRSDTSWSGIKSLLCVTDFPHHQPYYLNIRPADQYSSSDDELDSKEPKTMRVQTLLILQEDEDWTYMVGMDHNPFVKGKILPGNTDEHEIHFEDEQRSPAEAIDTEYGTVFRDWVQWSAYLSEHDQTIIPKTRSLGRRFFPYIDGDVNLASFLRNNA